MDCAGSLLVGLFIGWLLGRRRITHVTHLVYPAVRDRPLIYQVEGRVRPLRDSPPRAANE